MRGYITGVTDTALWTQYATGERELYGHTLARRSHEERTRSTRRSSPRRRRARTGRTTCRCRATTSSSAGSSTPDVWRRVQDAALALFRPRQRMRRPIRPDPRRHEVRVRPDDRRRAAADRRGPHPGLVTVVGRVDLRRPRRPRRRTREPRQGSRPPCARRRRLHRRRPGAGTAGRGLDGDHRPATSMRSND